MEERDRPVGGYRLGNGKTGANRKLAALARAGRAPKRHRLGVEDDRHNVSTAEETGYGLERALLAAAVDARERFAVLFKVTSARKGQLPDVDGPRFACALASALAAASPSRDSSRNSVAWTAPSLHAKHRLVCVVFRDRKDALGALDRFGQRALGSFRKILHGGEQLRLHALEMDTVYEGGETPFGFHLRQLGGNPFGSGHPSTSEHKHEHEHEHEHEPPSALGNLPSVLDLLGDDIVDVEAAFATHCCPTEGVEVVRGGSALRQALVQANVDARDLDGALSRLKLRVDGDLDMFHFCQLCACLKSRPHPVGANAADVEAVFDKFKLFPDDDFIEASDVPVALRCAGVECDGPDARLHLEGQGAQQRVRFDTFLSLVQRPPNLPF